MRLLFRLLSALLLFAAAPAAAATDEGVGLYVAMNHLPLPRFQPLYKNALTKPYVDGAALVVEWNAIEPEPDKYDWSHLDRWALDAIRHGKKLSLGVVAGFASPDWLYDAAHHVDFREFDYNRNPRGVACSHIRMPLPWDAGFLREYGKMIAALADHLRALKAGPAAKSAYALMTIAKLSGINVGTEEIRLNANPPDKGPCHQSDAIALWSEAGFTPEKIMSAWKSLVRATDAAFPNKTLDMEVIHRKAFPLSGPQPSDTNPKAPDALTSSLVNWTVGAYGHRLIVQWDALWQMGVPPELAEAKRDGARIGWQMNSFRGFDGSGCIYPPFKLAACRTEAEFESILDNGIRQGGLYIEIQAPDAAGNEHDAAFAAAHARLWATAGIKP